MEHSRWGLILCGLACVAAGVFPMLDALDFFPGSAARIEAPRWMVLVTASLFILSGLYVLLLALVGAGPARVFGSILGVGMFLGLAAIANWVAFGGGDRSDCSGGLASGGFSVSGGVPDWECRAAFGYGALLMDFMFLRGCTWWAGRRHPGSGAVRVLEKASTWALGFLLLPLVALVWLLTSGKDRLAGLFRRRPPADGGVPPSESR